MPIICDDSIFELLAKGDAFPYQKLLRRHFARLGTLYVLPETIEFLTVEKRIDLPFNVFAPFRLIVPDHFAIYRATALAVCESIPLHRALIVESSAHYLMPIAYSYPRTYHGLGLPWERHLYLPSRLGYNKPNVALRPNPN